MVLLVQQWANACHLKRRGTVFSQIYEVIPWIGNQFQNWIVSLSSFRFHILNLCTATFESNLNGDNASKVHVVLCYRLFVLCDGVCGDVDGKTADEMRETGRGCRYSFCAVVRLLSSDSKVWDERRYIVLKVFMSFLFLILYWLVKMHFTPALRCVLYCTTTKTCELRRWSTKYAWVGGWGMVLLAVRSAG